ncbi:MAG: hypothetical protein AMJ45_06840, partial [Syntrophobacter sp. DG_60]
MNDPHVEKLYYKVITGNGVDYENAPAVFEETNDFRMLLDGETAVFEMKTHFSTEKEAKAIVDEYLKQWDVLIGIEHNPDELFFKFDRANIVDRAPSPHGEHTLNIQGTVHITVFGHGKLHVSRGKYPSRPKRFSVSPDVETMYLRYKAYRKSQEPLIPMANLCLTVLQESARNAKGYKKRNNLRGKAAYQYEIEYDVLDKLGDLCANKGDEREARKAP